MIVRWLITWERIITAAFRNFLRNAWLSTAAIAMICVTLTVMLGFWMTKTAYDTTLDTISEKIDLAIFFVDETDPLLIEEFQAELEALPNVRSVDYIDKAAALERYRAQNEDNPDLRDVVSEEDNFLPTSFDIIVFDLNQTDEIRQLTKNEKYAPFVEDTNFETEDRKKVIESVNESINFITTLSIGVAGIFAAISVMIVFNTIRMAIYTRSTEIGIMRLIGATNWFIRGPFLVESMLYGAAAGIISMIVSYVGLHTITPRLTGADVIPLLPTKFDASIVYFDENWLMVGAVTLAVGMVLGLVSSLLALMRHLKL